MKYKVGDKVRIVSKWNSKTNQNWFGGMDKWLGKIMTIRAIDGRYYRMVEDQKDTFDGGWQWNEHCIAGLACNSKIVITTDGTETLARLYEGNKVVKSATAKCSPKDEFDFSIGAKLAFDRLTESPTEKKEKYYNGKVVCIDNRVGSMTVGKVYEFEDGYVTDDDGDFRPAYSRPKKELNSGWGMGCFIPLVE